MKSVIALLFSILSFLCVVAQQTNNHPNIFIITIDGFRWQEVFAGANENLLKNTAVVADTTLCKSLYGAETAEERRKKLLPFFWNIIATQGQIYGNRIVGNKSNAANIYKISYPGYNEMFTGNASLTIASNRKIINQHSNILQQFNQSEPYKGRVAAFASWNILPYVLNESATTIAVNAGYESLSDSSIISAKIDSVQAQIVQKSDTRYDWLTFLSAQEYIKQHKPKVVYIGLGETDEFAHQSMYDQYLQHATDIDRMIANLWYYIQTTPCYKNNTILLITTDHGRGEGNSNWHKHGLFTKGSGETWMAFLGAGIAPLGEMKGEQQLYLNQLAATLAHWGGIPFQTNKKIGKPILFPPLLQVQQSTTIVTHDNNATSISIPINK
jgi:hypothetical protein